VREKSNVDTFVPNNDDTSYNQQFDNSVVNNGVSSERTNERKKVNHDSLEDKIRMGINEKKPYYVVIFSLGLLSCLTALYSFILTVIIWIFQYRIMKKEKEAMGEISRASKLSMKGFLFIALFVSLVSCAANENSDTKSNVESSEPPVESVLPQATLEETPVPTSTVAPTKTPTKKKKTSKKTKKTKKKKTTKLTEQQYKKLCETMYYNKMIFTKKDLAGKKVKVYCYVEGGYRFDMYNLDSHEFAKKYKINASFIECGVKRKGTTSYVGKSINVYFPQKGQAKYENMKQGTYITIYGEIIEFARGNWDGYNIVGIRAKYIETRNQA
jgi:energy-coupling factor transporter transmembrane protein EcfT